MDTDEIKEIVNDFNSDFGSIELHYGEQNVSVFWNTKRAKGLKKLRGLITWENNNEYEVFEKETKDE